METIKFEIQGSASDPYSVTFQRVGTDIAAFCSCPAGDNGQACKHRLGILNGSSEGIVSGNDALVTTVSGWLAGSNLEQALAAVDRAETGVAKAKQELTKAKKALAATLLGPLS